VINPAAALTVIVVRTLAATARNVPDPDAEHAATAPAVQTATTVVYQGATAINVPDLAAEPAATALAAQTAIIAVTPAATALYAQNVATALCPAADLPVIAATIRQIPVAMLKNA